MMTEYEILEKYGNELKNGICPKEAIGDILIAISFDKFEFNYLIMNGTRDIDDTSRFYFENKEHIKSCNLSSDQIKEIYRHLRVMVNDMIICYCRMISELYFKMLKFQYIPESQTYHTMRAVVDQFNAFNWDDPDDRHSIYPKKIITRNMIERCYIEAKESLAHIYEVELGTLPENVADFHDFDSIKNGAFDIYDFVEKHSVIGNICEVL